MVGSMINAQWVGVSKDDQSGYSTLCIISFCCSFLGFALLPLIPTKAQIEERQAIRDVEEAAELKAQN